MKFNKLFLLFAFLITVSTKLSAMKRKNEPIEQNSNKKLDNKIENNKEHNLHQLSRLLWFGNPNSNTELSINKLIDSGIDDINCNLHNEIPPLLAAIIRKWNGEIIEKLIKSGANTNSTIPDHHYHLHRYTGISPLFIAISVNNKEAIPILIKYGADVNFIYENESILCKALDHNSNINIIKLLTKTGANVNYVGKFGSILMIANRFANPEIIKYLLDNGALINENVDDNGDTTLMVLLTNPDCSLDILKYWSAANMNHVNNNGKTPLLVALKSYQPHQVIKFLIDHGANVDYINPFDDNNDNNNALSITLNKDLSSTIIKCLVKSCTKFSNVDKYFNIIYDILFEEYTPLHKELINIVNQYANTKKSSN